MKGGLISWRKGVLDLRPLDYKKQVYAPPTSGNKFIDEMWQMYRGKIVPFRPLR